MALLIRIAGNFLQRPPLYAVRINVTWDRSWTQNLLQSTLTPVPTIPPGEIIFERPPLGPIQPLRSWAWSYNLNLIGKDALPIGAIVYALPPQPWAWVGKTWTVNLLQSTLAPSIALPVGDQIYALPPQAPLRTSPSLAVNLLQSTLIPTTPPVDTTTILRAPLYAPRNELTWYRDWSQNFVIRQVVTVKPFNQYDWPNPTIVAQPIRSWTWNYNLNLIGQDQLPIGDRVTDLPPPGYIYPQQLRTWISFFLPTPTVAALPFNQSDWPNPYGPKQPLRSWVWSYNLNLIGQDQLPTGKQIYDRPPLGPEQQPLRSWTWNYNLNLIGKDRLPTGKQIYDRPPYGPEQPLRSWSWSYNLNLIGQDQLPIGDRITDGSPGPLQPLRSWTWQYNLNLIAQDALPVGKQVYDLAPTGYIYPNDLRTWINRVNLALITQAAVLPFNQYDWPNPYGPKQPDRTWVWNYNLNLIGKDRLPTGKQVTDLPPRAYPEPATRTWTFSFNNNLIGKDKLPVGAKITDLPPRDYDRSIQLRSWTWSYSLNLIGKDRLPVGDIIYDLPPRAHTYPNDIRTYTKGLNLPIIVPPTKLPFNQYDWPSPSGWSAPYFDRGFYATRNPNLFPFVSPIPPPPDPTPPNTVEARPVRDFWDRDEWGNFIPGAGIRGT